jgi:hypothetical protein
MRSKLWLLTFLLLAIALNPAGAQVERIWLTHKSHDPSRLVVNWETARPGNSIVSYGTTPQLGRTVTKDENVTLHHVEIDLAEKDGIYHYRVESGPQNNPQISKIATFKGYPTQELRIAIVGDWGYARPDLTGLKQDNVHLLLTAGDNVPNLYQFGAVGEMNSTKAFSTLIDSAPELFASTPFMPVLGNHDREIRPRGPKPPAEPVYDIEATAYRKFFALPDEGWKWHFDVPDFNLSLIALDLNHISDLGTTWQTCHAFGADSEQFTWYRDLMTKTQASFVVTLQNERNATMRSQVGGAWGQWFEKGSAVVTGFGYFAERAEVNGFPYFNTSLKGDGDRYPDSKSAFLASEHSYLLLTLKRGETRMIAELKNLQGMVLDRREILARAFEK